MLGYIIGILLMLIMLFIIYIMLVVGSRGEDR